MTITVFSWRQAIQKSSLEATTKLVLYNLSIHMNDLGEGCFPSTETQALATGLSQRSVCTHLQKAATAGFLHITKHGLAGKSWMRNDYKAVWPGVFIPYGCADAKADYFEIGTERGSVPENEGTEPNDMKALNQVQSNSPLNSPISLKEKNIKKKKSPQLTLEDWEAEKGAMLNHRMLANWIKNKELHPGLVQEMIVIFRTKMIARGARQADFVAAFQNYINSGWMPKTLEQLKAKNAPGALRDNVTVGVSI